MVSRAFADLSSHRHQARLFSCAVDAPVSEGADSFCLSTQAIKKCPKTYLYKSVPHIQRLFHAERRGDSFTPRDYSPAGEAVHHILRLNLAQTTPNTAAVQGKCLK